MALSGVLERLSLESQNEKIVIKTITNGNLKVYNVPLKLYPDGIGPNGESDYIPGNVMYKLTKIYRYMLDHKITEMDFNEF